MLSAPGVLHPEALTAGSCGQHDHMSYTHRAEAALTGEELTAGEVSGDAVGTNVLPSISRID